MSSLNITQRIHCLLKMPPKLRGKTILESQDSVSVAAEAAHVELVLAMVIQFKRNTTDFLQGGLASNSPFRQEACIGNIDDDDDTHVPNAIEFQAMINNLQRFNALVGQRFDEKMVAQEEAESKQRKVLAEKTKAMSEYA